MRLTCAKLLRIDGGEWLSGAGEFNFLSKLKDEDWDRLKEARKAGDKPAKR